MKLFLKTIAGKQQEVSAEPTDTIADVKKALESEYNMPTLRLCFKGAVLEDSKTVQEIGLVEGDALVIAGKKLKTIKPTTAPAAQATPPTSEPTAPAPTAPAQAATSSPVAPATEAPAPAPAPEPAKAEAETAAPTESAATPDAAPAPPPAQETPSAASAEAPAPASVAPTTETPAAPTAPAAPEVPTFGVDADLIDTLVGMGFDDRVQVAMALRAAFMNLDRAVEYLCSGIPPQIEQRLRQEDAERRATARQLQAGGPGTAPSQDPATTGASAHPAGAAPSGGTTTASPAAPPSDMRTLLMQIPNFEAIRATFQRDNQVLASIANQIKIRYPHVFTLIEANPSEFIQIMSETGGAPSTTDSTTLTGDDLPPSLQITDADRHAVSQLVELGGGLWDEEAALLVYLATQRNAEVAASVLFEHGGVPPELLQQIAEQMMTRDAEDGESDDDVDEES